MLVEPFQALIFTQDVAQIPFIFSICVVEQRGSDPVLSAKLWLPEGCYAPFFYQKPSTKINTSYIVGAYPKRAKPKEDQGRRQRPSEHFLGAAKALSCSEWPPVATRRRKMPI